VLTLLETADRAGALKRRTSACMRTRRPGSGARTRRQDHQHVTTAPRIADLSRNTRHQGGGGDEIHRLICRNSSSAPCLTYGFVGYGYVSVQALVPVSPRSRGAR